MKVSFHKVYFTIGAFIELLGNSIDYIFLLFQIRGIISFALTSLSDFSSFLVLMISCFLFHLFLMISKATRIQLSKYISAVSLSFILIIIFIQIANGYQIHRPKWPDFVIFDKGRNLQAGILLLGSFRFNKEILELKDLDRKIKKFDDEEGVKGYSKASVYYFIVLGCLYGFLYYLENLPAFHNDTINLRTAMSIYNRAASYIKIVVFSS